MSLQFSTVVRNAELDAIEAAIGTGAIIKIRTGATPANCGTADSGTVLASMTLGPDWMDAASSGAKALSNLPVTDTSADNTGTAGHYRLYASDGVTCHAQGSVTLTGGGGDMTVDNTSFVSGQQFQITAFTWTAGNA